MWVTQVQGSKVQGFGDQTEWIGRSGETVKLKTGRSSWLIAENITDRYPVHLAGKSQGENAIRFTLMISEISTRNLKISSLSKTGDMSARPALVPDYR